MYNLTYLMMLRGLMLVCVLSIGFSATSFAQRARVGKQAPEISGVTILNSEQETVSLEELRGKVVILEFWATWCGPCISTGQYLDELQEEHGDILQVVSLSDEDRGTVERFLRRRPSSAMVGIYEGYAVANAYPHNSIPHGILIDPSGEVVAIDHPMRFTAQRIERLYAKASASQSSDTMGTAGPSRSGKGHKNGE